MARDKKQKSNRNRKWENEAKALTDARHRSDEKKRAARAAGYQLPFFDYLDDYQVEFENTVNRARTLFSPFLVDVLETNCCLLDPDAWSGRIPQEWSPVTYHYACDEGQQAQYGFADGRKTNLLGVVHTFLTPAEEVRLLVLINNEPPVSTVHRQWKFMAKLAFLLHEFGHVRDIIDCRHQNPHTGVSEPIEAEVSANCFAFEECRKYGYRLSFDTLLRAVQNEQSGLRAEVARRTLLTCDLTPPQSWPDLIGC